MARCGHVLGAGVLPRARELSGREIHVGDGLESDWRSSVSRLIEQCPGMFGMAEAAERLHITERSLRRRLAMQGCTFAELLDGHRRRRALMLIACGDLPMAVIAVEVGFSDARSLRRAVRRWTDAAPLTIRTRGVVDDDHP